MQVHDIVYATDFSPCAARAFPPAVELARKLGARLHVVHVMLPPLPMALDPMTYVPPAEETIEQLRKDAQLQVDALAVTARARDVEVRTVLVDGGPAAESLLHYAQTHAAGLVVLGTNGRSAPARILLGSVALRVIRHAGCPVLAIRADGGEVRATPPRRILVAFDFSPLARRTLEWAGDLTRALGGTLELLHVPEEIAILEASRGASEDYRTWRRDELHRLEQRLGDAAELHAAGVPAVITVQPGRPAAVLQERARAAEADWIALGTHGYAGLERLLYGSTAEEVLHRAEIPVLLLNPGCLTRDEARTPPAAHTAALVV